MAYQFKHIFCATAAQLEAERTAFHEVLAELNETYASQSGILLVPVSLSLQMSDKRVFQSAVDWNIRQSSVFLQVLDGSWGPAQRNFESDYALALRCVADPALPMQKVAILTAKPIEEFKQNLRLLLEEWLRLLVASCLREAVSQ